MKRLFRFAVCAVLCFALLAANLCFASSASEFYSTVEMLHIESHMESDVGLSEYATVQGACIGGDYAYFAFMNGSVCNVAKYDAHSWEYLEKQQIVNMGHSNDMTYNPDKDYLVVANNAPYYDVITLVDPDTLSPIKDVKIDEDIYSISYNEKRKSYVVGLSGTYDFALLDSDFKVKKKFEGEKTGYTRQGCDCDDDYIYFVQSGGSNLLVVYDYSGKHITDIPMTNSDEVENIFHIGDAFYVSLYYYGDKLYRIGFNDKTKITYNVSYDANGGEGEMKSTTVHYGEKTALRPCEFTREGYFFAGWRAQRTCDGKYIGCRNGASDFEWLDADDVFEYVLYDDKEEIAETVKYGGLKLSAVWYAEQYDVNLNSGEGEGEPFSFTLGHDAEYMVPDLEYNREGYIFDGYEATREYDGRVYGYRAGSDKPEWLYPSDAAQTYHFRPEETIRALTPEGGVDLTAQYKFAYTFGEDGSTLVEYVGVDEKVVIPGNNGELTTLGEGAIKDNEIITELYIPAGVNSMQKQAIANCPKLRNVYFDGALPENIDGDCFVGDASPVVYEVRDGKVFYIGFFSGPAGVPILQYHARELEKRLQEWEAEAD